MDNQNFINFSENSNCSSNPDSNYSLFLGFFKEIFSSCYGTQNLIYLKDNYLYFDKYGKQRKIDFAIFTNKGKYAIIFDGFESDVCEEYRFGDRKIIENSLRSQSWDLYYWSYKGKKEHIRKKTYKDMQILLGKNPNFLDYMGNEIKEPVRTNYITPIVIIIAIVGALVIFPKISDKLFSTTRVKDNEKNISVDYKALGIDRKEEKIKKEKKSKEPLENIDKYEGYNSEDF